MLWRRNCDVLEFFVLLIAMRSSKFVAEDFFEAFPDEMLHLEKIIVGLSRSVYSFFNLKQVDGVLYSEELSGMDWNVFFLHLQD